MFSSSSNTSLSGHASFQTVHVRDHVKYQSVPPFQFSCYVHRSIKGLADLCTLCCASECMLHQAKLAMQQIMSSNAAYVVNACDSPCDTSDSYTCSLHDDQEHKLQF